MKRDFISEIRTPKLGYDICFHACLKYFINQSNRSNDNESNNNDHDNNDNDNSNYYCYYYQLNCYPD